MKFNIKDVNIDAITKRCKKESEKIFSQSSTARGRTLEQILESSRFGLVAEQYLLENGFTDDPRPFKDVFDQLGREVEVKVTSKLFYVSYVLSRARDAKDNTWRNYPDILYIFIGGEKTGDYFLEGIYLWNGTFYIKQETKNE